MRRVVGLALAAAAFSQSGCDNVSEAAEEKAAKANQTPIFWKLEAANSAQIARGLSICMAAIKEKAGQHENLRGNGWKERPIPSWAVTTKQSTVATTVFAQDGMPILIALSSDRKQQSVEQCSVLTAANDNAIKVAVEIIDGGFSKNMAMMPHGPWWTAGGVRIDNDYANLHVFEPQVFDPEDFRTGAISDIRVYKCKEHCE